MVPSAPAERRAVTIAAPVVAFDEGGMERVMSRVAGGLLDQGFAVTVIAYICKLEPHPALRFVRIPGPRRPAALSFPWFAIAASVAIRRYGRGKLMTQGAIVPQGADVACIHFCHHAFYAGRQEPRRRRDTLPYRANEWLDRSMTLAAERWVYGKGRAKTAVAVSSGVAEELGRCFPALGPRVRVIPNGVDLDEFRPDETARARVRETLGLGDAPLAVFMGGDWARKGLGVALGALAEAPPWHLLVVGDGDREQFEARAAELGIVERVHFVGRQAQPAPFLAAGDAFLLPSAYEPFGLVMLEAGACGLPLVVSRTDGSDELVREGENGVVVERRAEAFAAALTALAEDPARRRGMGDRGRQLAADYGWPRVVAAYAEVLACG